MGAGTHENDLPDFAAVVQFVGQQKVAADVTLTMPVSIASQRVVEPFRAEWPIIGDKKQHDFFKPCHVVPARVR